MGSVEHIVDTPIEMSMALSEMTASSNRSKLVQQPFVFGGNCISRTNFKMLNLNPQLMKFRLYDVRKRSKEGKHVDIAQREKDVLLDLNRD